jgi:hypothetical protein
MSLAFRCEECGIAPDFRIERRGDAVVTWACYDHLNVVCARFLATRHWEPVTQLVVTGYTGKGSS